MDRMADASAEAFQHVERAGSGARADGRAWGCDDVNEGTLHNGAGDARVDGEGDQREAAAATAARLSALEVAAREQRNRRKRTRDGSEAAVGGETGTEYGLDQEVLAPGAAGAGMLSKLFGLLKHFSLRGAHEGKSELQLYDAMRSPDRALLRHGVFVAEGSLVIEQILSFSTVDDSPERFGLSDQSFQLLSILATEQMLARLAPVIQRADESIATQFRASAPHAEDAPSLPAADTGKAACIVFSGSRSDLSEITGFKHSSLSALAIVRRPAAPGETITEWLSHLKPARGVARPTLLILDGVSGAYSSPTL